MESRQRQHDSQIRLEGAIAGAEASPTNTSGTPLEIYESCEVFVKKKDGDLQYSHLALILKRGDEFFSASAANRSITDADLNSLRVEPIELNHVWPRYTPELSRASQPLPADCYVKRPSLVHYNKEFAAKSPPSKLLLEEARICEILLQHPHPNIASYMGCVVNGSRISGLCFVRY